MPRTFFLKICPPSPFSIKTKLLPLDRVLLNNWLIVGLDGLGGLGSTLSSLAIGTGILSTGEVDSETATTDDSGRELVLGLDSGSGIDEFGVGKSLGLVGAPRKLSASRSENQEAGKSPYLSVATRISMQLLMSWKASKSSSLVML
jgi:hypothetical protein